MVNLKPLSEELQKIANEELAEVPSRISQDLKAFKDWLATQAHLKARTDDQFLIQFLRCCKYDMGRAKVLLDIYYSLKSKHPEVFNPTDVDEPKYRKLCSMGTFTILPVPLHGNGPHILTYQFSYLSHDYTVYDTFAVVSAMHEFLIMTDPYACIQGVIYIVDFAQATEQDYLRMTVDFCKKTASFLGSIPLRVKSFYYINTAAAPKAFFSDLISNFPIEIQQKVLVLENGLEALLKEIPLKYLHSDLNGGQPSLLELTADYDRVWLANREYLQDNAMYGTEEQLRPGKPFDLECLFEANGCFDLKVAEVRPLSAELQKIAIEELGELPTRIPQNLRTIKEWLATQQHLKSRRDDQFLIQFLRCCKYNLEDTKKKLDLHFSLKSRYPKMLNLSNVDDEKLRKLSRLGCWQPLPEPLQGNGPRLIFFQFNQSPNEYDIEEVMQSYLAMHEILAYNDPYACIRGIIYIVDFGKANASHYGQMSPDFCKPFMSFLESMPLRVQSIYYINVTPEAQQFLKILLSFFSRDMRQKLHIMCDSLELLLRDIPLQYLPQDLGGCKPSMLELCAEYDKVWDANREYFKENAQFDADDQLRV